MAVLNNNFIPKELWVLNTSQLCVEFCDIGLLCRIMFNKVSYMVILDNPLPELRFC